MKSTRRRMTSGRSSQAGRSYPENPENPARINIRPCPNSTSRRRPVSTEDSSRPGSMGGHRYRGNGTAELHGRTDIRPTKLIRAGSRPTKSIRCQERLVITEGEKFRRSNMEAHGTEGRGGRIMRRKKMTTDPGNRSGPADDTPHRTIIPTRYPHHIGLTTWLRPRRPRPRPRAGSVAVPEYPNSAVPSPAGRGDGTTITIATGRKGHDGGCWDS